MNANTQKNQRMPLLEVLVCTTISLLLTLVITSHGQRLRSVVEYLFIEYISDSNDLLLVLTFIFLGLISFIFISSIIHSALREDKEVTLEGHKNKYQSYFAQHISQPSSSVGKLFDAETDANEDVYLSVDDFAESKNRAIMLSELKGMHAMIEGEEKDRLRELYFTLGFVPELSSRLSSAHWVTRAEAIQEVRQFQVKSYYEKVFTMVNDSHPKVRRVAVVSRVVLDNDPMSILYDVKSPLSQWERHNILSALKKLPSHKIPLFCTLYLEAPVHVEFLRELCIQFHQRQTLEEHKLDA